MQFIATDTDIVVVEHNGNQIQWSTKIFDSKRLNSSTGVFNDINGFIAKQHAFNQQQIWDIYVKIHECLLTPSSNTQTITNLQNLIADLYQHFDFAAVEHYVKFYCNVFIPDTVKDQHSLEDNNPSRTYLKTEFIQLAAFTVMLRPMIPIWGEFIRTMASSIAALNKDLTAYRLLSKTQIHHGLVAERLKAYVSAHLGNEEMPAAVILFTGLPSDRIPEWMMSIIIIRRMVISQVTSNTGEIGNLISNIYGYLRNCLRDIETRHSQIRDKRRDDAKEDETERSLSEDTRVKEALTPGNLQVIEIHAEDCLRLALEMDPTVPPEYVERCLSLSNSVLNVSITQTSPQIIIAAWMVKSIPSLSVFTLDKKYAINVIIAAQAVLFHWDLPTLALLITATPSDNVSEGVMVGSGRSVKIHPDLVEILTQQYPYPMVEQGNYSKTNYACSEILTINRDISLREWNVSVPPGFEKVCEKLHYPRTRTMHAPHDLPDHLAKMVIRINQGA